MAHTSSTNDIEDELILVRCQLGERAAFDDLIRRWSPLLYRHACRRTGDLELARDLTQDIWLRVLRGIGGLRDRGQFRAWLFGIAHRTFMDRLRERYTRPAVMDFDPEDLVDDSFDDEVLGRALHTHLERLPKLDRDTLTLFYLQEYSIEEMASLLDIPAGTVKSRLFRARAALRALMSPQEIKS